MRVVVLGSGVEGQSAFAYFTRHGHEVDVLEHIDNINIDSVAKADLVIKSPGIPYSHPVIDTLLKQGVSLSSVTKYFFEQCPTHNTIGVTGTKGKGTTSSLIYEILNRGGKNTYLGGNIGKSPLDFLDELNDSSYVVLELSSFQLMNLGHSPHIAVLLMITSEHLDWHKSTQEYIQAKSSLVASQGPNDTHIVNISYPNSLLTAASAKSQRVEVSANKSTRGCYVDGSMIVWNYAQKSEIVMSTNDIQLPGEHNQENVCAAVAAAKILSIDNKSIVRAVSHFAGLEHRIEKVTTIGDVTYYNDSFSTTPETAIAAIRAFTKPKVLIIGGSSKNSDFTQLAQEIVGHSSIRAIIGIGDEWNKIKTKLPASGLPFPVIEGLETMEQIVQKAHKIAHPGDVVLLSPACASFGMFRDYKDRGAQFKRQVVSLKNSA